MPPAHIGSIQGAVSMIRNAATAAGPPLATLLAGLAESFERILLPFAALAVFGAAVAVFLRPPPVIEDWPSSAQRRMPVSFH